jgi:putative membrane protein
VKFWLRWTANSIAIYLALYLVDSVAGGRFRVEALWAAVIIAVLLGFLNSLVRPLRRLRSKPVVALSSAVLTVLVNTLVLQVFVWIGEALSAQSFAWVLAVAAFISLVAGTINWLIGFKSKEKQRASAQRRREAGAVREGEAKSPRTRA